MTFQNRILDLIEPTPKAHAFAVDVANFVATGQADAESISARFSQQVMEKKEEKSKLKAVVKKCHSLLAMLSDDSITALLDFPEPVRSAEGLVAQIKAKADMLDRWRQTLAVISEAATTPKPDKSKMTRRDLRRASKEVVTLLAVLWHWHFEELPTAWHDDDNDKTSAFCQIAKVVLAEMKLVQVSPKTMHALISTRRISDPKLPFLLFFDSASSL